MAVGPIHPKVKATALAGAVTTIVLAVLAFTGVVVDPVAVGSLIAAAFAILAGYITPGPGV